MVSNSWLVVLSRICKNTQGSRLTLRNGKNCNGKSSPKVRIQIGDGVTLNPTKERHNSVDNCQHSILCWLIGRAAPGSFLARGTLLAIKCLIKFLHIVRLPGNGNARSCFCLDGTVFALHAAAGTETGLLHVDSLQELFRRRVETIEGRLRRGSAHFVVKVVRRKVAHLLVRVLRRIDATSIAICIICRVRFRRMPVYEVFVFVHLEGSQIVCSVLLNMQLLMAIPNMSQS